MCLVVGGSNCKFWEKNPQAHLIIKNNDRKAIPILGNLDDFSPGAFYWTPPPLQLSTIEYIYVYSCVFIFDIY